MKKTNISFYASLVIILKSIHITFSFVKKLLLNTVYYTAGVKMKLNFLLIVVFVLNSTIIFGKQNNDISQNSIITGISFGYEKVEYNAINAQLKRYHELDGVDYFLPIDIHGTFLKKHLVLNTCISGGFNKLEKNEMKTILDITVPFNRKILFYNLNTDIKIGFRPFLNSNLIVYPYLGICFEYLWIHPEMSYRIRHLNCFFTTDKRYSTYNTGLIYGAVFNKYFKIKKLPGLYILGCEIGGTISFNKEYWNVNNTKQHPPSYHMADVPEFDPNFFLKVYLGLTLHCW